MQHTPNTRGNSRIRRASRVFSSLLDLIVIALISVQSGAESGLGGWAWFGGFGVEVGGKRVRPPSPLSQSSER